MLTTSEQVRIVFKDSDKHHKALNNNSGYLMGQLLGECVGLISRDDWKRVRAVFEPAFTHEAAKTYVPLITARTELFFQGLESSPRILNGTIDPAQDLRMLPFWVVAEILYGTLTQDMETELESIAPLREEIFKCIIEGGITRYSWSQYLPIRANRMLASFQKRWHAFNDKAELTASNRGFPYAPISLMYNSIRDGRCSRPEILQTLDEILYANLDVTLGGLTWNLVQLAANTAAQDRLRTEIAQARAETKGEDERSFTDYVNSSSSYLQSVISESSRLRPLAAFSVPQSAPTPRILDGYRIPAGTNFIVDSHSLNEENAYWQPDPSKFRPERFQERKTGEARYSFWRYGFGPRQCLGKYVADLIIRVLLVHLIESYELGLVSEEDEWKRDTETWIDHPDMRLTCKKRGV